MVKELNLGLLRGSFLQRREALRFSLIPRGRIRQIVRQESIPAMTETSVVPASAVSLPRQEISVE